MDCPFLNQDRPLCSERLNMQRLEDAYELCMDNFMFCPVYLLLSRNESRLLFRSPDFLFHRYDQNVWLGDFHRKFIQRNLLPSPV